LQQQRISPINGFVQLVNSVCVVRALQMICEAAAAIRKLTGQDPLMLAPTASAVQTLKEAGYTADTVANFRDKIEFHDAARGRVIWCVSADLIVR